jgi:hypothetical protein
VKVGKKEKAANKAARKEAYKAAEAETGKCITIIDTIIHHIHTNLH